MGTQASHFSEPKALNRKQHPVRAPVHLEALNSSIKIKTLDLEIPTPQPKLQTQSPKDEVPFRASDFWVATISFKLFGLIMPYAFPIHSPTITTGSHTARRRQRVFHGRKSSSQFQSSWACGRKEFRLGPVWFSGRNHRRPLPSLPEPNPSAVGFQEAPSAF